MALINLLRKEVHNHETTEIAAGAMQHTRLKTAMFVRSSRKIVPGDWLGCRIGNGEKLICSQAEPSQATTSAVD